MNMDEPLILPNLDRQIQEQQTAINSNNDPTALKKRAAQLEAIIDHIPEAVIVTDQKGRLMYMNRAAGSILGNPASDLEPEAWPMQLGFFLDDATTYYPADSMPLVRALRGEVVDGEEMIMLRANDPKAAWISMSAQPLTDEIGQVTGSIVLLQDITYRKQIELSQENHARRVEILYNFSHAIAESSNDLTTITNVVAVHTAQYFGDACIVALLNPNRDRLRVAAFHHPEAHSRALLRKYLMLVDYELSEDILKGVIQSGEPLLIPYLSPERLKAITTTEFTNYVGEMEIQGILIVPITGRGGILGSIGVFRKRERSPYTVDDQSFLTVMSQRTALAIENSRLFDSLREQVSAQLSARQALNVSEERFRAIFESTTLGIKVLDLEGKILQINPAFQDILGYYESELVGRHFYSFIYSDDATRAIRLVHDLKVSGVPDVRFEHRALHKDGSIVWAKTTFTGVKKGGGDDSLAFIVGIVENITEQKRIELEMAELKNRLQGNLERERLRVAQELHDGPMQELYSTIYQIEELRSTVDDRQKDTLDKVRQDIQIVLKELRETAKELRPPTLADFGLEKAVRSYVEDFQEKHPGLTVHLQLAQDRQTLPENVRLALFRILQQSLANVVRHAEASQVNVHFAFDAEDAALEITDNGKGFEVPRNWVGLVRQGHFGLAGAAERIEALGGSFTVKSRSGEGTTIWVKVPVKNLSIEEA